MAADPAPAINKAIVLSRLPAHAVRTVLAITAAEIVVGLTATATLAAIIVVVATGALVADQAAAAIANWRRSGFHRPSFQQPGE
jgi:hypothetical protein